MAEHTPGPWRWFDYPDGRKLLAGKTAAVIHCSDTPLVIMPADQTLIAAAPELKDALKALVAETERRDNPGDMGVGSDSPEMQAARAAIAKAEGRL